MEKIKIQDKEFEIVSINQKGALLQVEFSEATGLSSEDLSEIEVLTAGGVGCAILTGYASIYKVDGNIVTLSNDGSVYTEVEPEPVPESYVPTEEELANQAAQQKISSLKHELEATDYRVIKCSEYQLMGLESPYDVIELHSSRQELRDRINTLEAGLL